MIAFSDLSEGSNDGSLVVRQFQAAASYNIDRLSERQPLSGSSSARQANARIAKSKDSQDCDATLWLQQNISYSALKLEASMTQNS
jgi:hypothetical protein